MKKIIVAVCAMGLAIVAQAASYNWKATTGFIYSPTDSSTKITSGTAYLFDAKVTQQSVLTALLSGSDISTLGAISTSSVSAAGQVFASDNFTYKTASDVGTSWEAYMVVVNGDYAYFSNKATDIMVSIMESTDTISIPNNMQTSKNVYDTEKFGSAGWYTLSSSSGGGESETVPEPTSGLLLLVGMGALALRRKQK